MTLQARIFLLSTSEINFRATSINKSSLVLNIEYFNTHYYYLVAYLVTRFSMFNGNRLNLVTTRYSYIACPSEFVHLCRRQRYTVRLGLFYLRIVILLHSLELSIACCHP